MLNKHFYQSKTKQDLSKTVEYSFIRNTTHIDFLGCRLKAKIKNLQSHGNHILKSSSICMQMTSAFSPGPSQKQSKTCWEFKHCSRLMKTHWVPTRSLPRSYTSSSRCGPDGLIQKQGRENLGFPLKNMKNMKMEKMKNMHAKIITCYYKV